MMFSGNMREGDGLRLVKATNLGAMHLWAQWKVDVIAVG